MSLRTGTMAAIPNWVERVWELDETLWRRPIRAFCARRVRDARGRFGLALELPESIAEPDATPHRLVAALARGIEELTSGRAGPGLSATSASPALAGALAMLERRLPAGAASASFGNFVSLPHAGAPVRLRWNESLLELCRAPAPVDHGVAEPGAWTKTLQNYAGAVNGQLRLAQLALDGDGVRLSVCLPLPGLSAADIDRLIGAALDAIVAAERVLPDPRALAAVPFAEWFGFAGHGALASTHPLD